MPLTLDHFTDLTIHCLLSSQAVVGVVGWMMIVETTKPPALLRDGL